MVKSNMKGKINHFITRCFRDVADEDYIVARLCWRRHLHHQFYWMGLQAIEKYLKAILLFSRKSTHGLSHNLPKALGEAEKIAAINLKLEPRLIKFIEHLNEQGPNRYFEWTLWVQGEELLLLDECVWTLRSRCVSLDGNAKRGDKVIWTAIEHFEKLAKYKPGDNPVSIWLPFGRLEKILSEKSEARKDLAWKNFYYGRRIKNSIQWGSQARWSYPTHNMHPAIFASLDPLVKFSKGVRDHFMKKAQRGVLPANKRHTD